MSKVKLILYMLWKGGISVLQTAIFYVFYLGEGRGGGVTYACICITVWEHIAFPTD